MRRLIQGLLFVSVSISAGGVAVADKLSQDSADSMTCGSNFISVGDPEDKVLETCGEPSFREGNRWTYSDVPGSFVYELDFGGGNVVSIHTRMAD